MAESFRLLSSSKWTDFSEDKRLHLMIIFTRAVFLVGVCLVVAGGSLEGQYHQPSLVAQGTKLLKAGYVAAVLNIALLAAFIIFFFSVKATLSTSSVRVSLHFC